ncbi:MAG TPA: crosslink repair DNA glycosylase YcaQ family protein [Ilumatobacter sp.]|nr:crosslink repair DNA glycosylase YcaQ family protein [Ilumatobacter sp.]
MTERLRLSADEARRIALTAQGFDRKRPRKPTRTHLTRMFDDIGVVQIDTVNVTVRAHEMTVFSRLGPHPRGWLDQAVADGELFEYFTHGTSYIPTQYQHLHRWRQSQYGGEPSQRSIGVRKPEVVAGVLAQVKRRGPLHLGDIEGRVKKKNAQWWDWDDAKQALEHLFVTGQVAVTRRPDFGKLFDLPERVIPAAALAVPTPPVAEARKELAYQAARALGVATHQEIAYFHWQNAPKVRPWLRELVDEGRLVEVDVEGWKRPGYLHPGIAERAPKSFSGRALVGPFDPLMWFRERISRVFRFDYTLEIFVPAAKRVWGYYVYPFLYKGHFAGRVDLKADRQAGTLRVQAAYIEADLDNPHDRPEIAEQLAAELGDLARWLGLDTVGAVDKGNLARTLHTIGVTALDP